MNSDRANILEFIEAELDIPESAYLTAEERYKSIGDHLGTGETESGDYDPHVRPQGSFRLGTVVRPLNAEDEFDLDITCRFEEGITHSSHTQEALKELIGRDLEKYRTSKGIRSPLEPKRRCWRLGYADTLRFHIDIVPSIPETKEARQNRRALLLESLQEELAESVSEHASAITDTEHKNYSRIDSEWPQSNPEGYAVWFESRLRLAQVLLEERARAMGFSKVEDLKIWQIQSPLQRALKVLKRHRDVLFQDNPDSKPISIIITTLAGHAYQGERDVESALEGILNRMDRFINQTKPLVENPVYPLEDFADKWYEPEYARYRLKQNFDEWLKQARADFAYIRGFSGDLASLKSTLKTRFGISVSEQRLRDAGILVDVPQENEPPHFNVQQGHKPWLRTE